MYKTNLILLISLQILVKSSVSNIIFDLPYKLNKHMQYKHVWKLFQGDYLHQHTVIALYRLDRNEKSLRIFEYPSYNRAFYRPELNI